VNIHLFDVDYTILRKSTAYYFLLAGLKGGVFSLSRLGNLPVEWLRYKFGSIHHDFIEKAVTHLAGIDERDINTLAVSCFEHSIKPHLYAEAIVLIQDLRQKGEEVRLATSAFSHLIQPLERFLGLEPSIASVLEFAGGKTTGGIDGKALFGQNKKGAVETWLTGRNIPRENLWFYSDSYTDIPLLEFAGHPAAVNPDRFLKKKALEYGWKVLRWGK
jgi:HAD superfamily hydrolase (TIGR01490 family)